MDVATVLDTGILECIFRLRSNSLDDELGGLLVTELVYPGAFSEG